MLEAVLVDPDDRTVVGLLPKPAFRDIILDVEPSDGVVIFDPVETRKARGRGTSALKEIPRPPMVGYGGDGRGSGAHYLQTPLVVRLPGKS